MLGPVSEQKKGNRFQPGQSGNPGGRVKGFERRLREVIEGETVEHPKHGAIPAWEAIVLQAIEDAVHGTSPAARHYGRQFIADRVMGKPKQALEITNNSPLDRSDVSKLSDEELVELAAGTDHTGTGPE